MVPFREGKLNCNHPIASGYSGISQVRCDPWNPSFLPSLVLAQEMLHFLCLWNKGSCCQGCVAGAGSQSCASSHPGMVQQCRECWCVCLEGIFKTAKCHLRLNASEAVDWHLPSAGHELPGVFTVRSFLSVIVIWPCPSDRECIKVFKSHNHDWLCSQLCASVFTWIFLNLSGFGFQALISAGGMKTFLSFDIFGRGRN